LAFERIPKVAFPLPDLVGTAVTAVRDRARVVTFFGPGGAGATGGALQTAAALSGDFPSVHFVDPPPLVHPGRVARFVAEVLQARIQGPNLDASESVIHFLRELGTTLLVLDSCDRALVECRSLLADLLRGCPSLTVLATANEPLGLPGERTITL